jgi:actin-like ATPase involved in cell morphogenesis
MSFWSRLGSWLRRKAPARTNQADLGENATAARIERATEPAVAAARAQPLPNETPAEASPAAADVARANSPEAEVPPPSAPEPAPLPPSAIEETGPAIEPEPIAPQAVPVDEPSPDAQVADLRIGIDFGTSTTQVTVRIGQADPQLLELEPGLEYLPSYIALREDGTLAFGSEARNLPDSVHSIKPLLIEDEPLEALGGQRPSDAAQEFLAEVVRRTLAYLRSQRLIPETLERLEVATNLGTTARFDLLTRTRLRDVANVAGINVRLAELVEEPLAAAYELIYGGTASDGTLMVVDIGGGTVDIAVVRSDLGSGKFELFATRGARVAGDKFTEVLVKEIERVVDERAGARDWRDRQSETLTWSRAEAAKRALADLGRTRVPLGGIGGLSEGEIVLDEGWYAAACRKLRAELLNEIKSAYRMARLSLGRGGPDDPGPGTTRYKIGKNGQIWTLADIDVSEDARSHLDAVILVGGGSQLPMIRALMRDAFGTLVQESFVDPVGAIALGLGRTRDMKTVNMRYPGWGISISVDGVIDDIPLYEPYAPTMRVSQGDTAEYGYSYALPEGHGAAIQVVFKEVGATEAVIWPRLAIPADTQTVHLNLNLLGQMDLLVGRGDGGTWQSLNRDRADLRVPWTPPEGEQVAWLPKPNKQEWWQGIPDYDRNANP